MEKQIEYSASRRWNLGESRMSFGNRFRVVIIADENNQEHSDKLRSYLSSEDYRVESMFCSNNLRELYREKNIDLLVVTVSCNSNERIAAVRDLVLTTPMRVMLVTQGAELLTRVEGLDAGAEDCVDENCNAMEFKARVRAILRRANPVQLRSQPLSFGPLVLDIENRTVKHQDLPSTITLTETETRLLTLLMLENGRPVAREKMQGRESVNQADRSVDVHIGHIRKKLRDADFEHVEVSSVWGYGYRLNLLDPIG